MYIHACMHTYDKHTHIHTLLPFLLLLVLVFIVFLLVGKPLEFTRPSLDGSTVVVVARDTEVGSTIYTVESNTDSATYAVIGKHRTTFTCDGDKIILVKPLKDKSNNWYGVQIGYVNSSLC